MQQVCTQRCPSRSAASRSQFQLFSVVPASRARAPQLRVRADAAAPASGAANAPGKVVCIGEALFGESCVATELGSWGAGLPCPVGLHGGFGGRCPV